MNSTDPEASRSQWPPNWKGLNGIAALGLIACCVFLLLLSPRFVYGGDYLERPVLEAAATLLAAGAIYLLWIRRLVRNESTRHTFATVVVVGAIMRAVLSFSTPILEDDYHRYLWDGAVAANGFNPYAYVPFDVLVQAEGVPEPLSDLGARSGEVLERVNHPHLGTVYPPVAQAAFTAAYWLRPWSFGAWRAVVSLLDIGVLLLLVALLRTANQPVVWSGIYWCNPLLVKEFYNSAHMDVVVIPLLLAALFAAIKRWPIRSAALLSLAFATKLWPIVLLPLLLRPYLARPRTIVAAMGVFAGFAALLFLPVLPAFELGERSGFLAYGESWQMNDALFMTLLWIVDGVVNLLGGAEAVAERLARLLALAIVACVVAWTSYSAWTTENDLFRRCLVVVAAVFLLSPTQFPWYFLWLLPLLALYPNWPLLLFTPLLALYYMRFYFVYHDSAAIFDRYIVWIEFVPVWLLLFYQWRATRSRIAEKQEIMTA